MRNAQYRSAAAMFASDALAGIPVDDVNRIKAYALYEDMYYNNPDTYKLVARGSETNPIYIPTAKTIIEATHRFLMINLQVSLVSDSDADKEAARATLNALFRRENFHGKVTTQKRFGLIRGDSVWHIIADDSKPATRRISLIEADPSHYFPEIDPSDPERIVSITLANPISSPIEEGKKIIKRQRYRRTEAGRITTELGYFALDGWDDRINPETGKQYHEVIKFVNAGNLPTIPEEELPPQITAFPVYHIRNSRIPLNPFGVSEVQGLEIISAAINQTITDEELAIALEGVGMYATDSGAPVDEDGETTDWILGPGRVVEIGDGKKFTRVAGITSIDPLINHMDFLRRRALESSGIPDVAIGKVDVQMAESGIALALQLAPMIAKNSEKEGEMLAVYDHMLFDLINGWLPAYEKLTFAVDAMPVVDDPMPVDRAAVIKETLSLVSNTPPLITVAEAQRILTEKCGLSFDLSKPEELLKQISDAATAVDPFAARMASDATDQ